MTAALTLSFAAAASPALAEGKGSSHKGAYVQTNLVSHVPGLAPVLDPNLVNPWGLSFGPATPLWVANEGTATSTLYRGVGAVSTVPLVVPTPAHPTGTVFNPTSAFALPDGTRPFRSHVDPADDGSEEVSVVADRVREEFLTRLDLGDLLHPSAQQ